MTYILIALAVLFGLYFFLIVAPCIVSFFTVFFMRAGREDVRDYGRTYCEPYLDRLNGAYDRITGLQYSDVNIKAYDGTDLYGRYIDNNSDKTILFFNGYRANPIGSFAPMAVSFYEEGFNLLFAHQRCHGKSGGRKCTLGINEQNDVLSFIKYIENTAPDAKIIIAGISMGCATLSFASDKIESSNVKAFILDCGFSSPYESLTRDMKIRHMPYQLMMPVTNLLARIFLRVNLKTSVRDSLKNCKKPALFLHGANDETVPIVFGKGNYEVCNAEKRFIEVENAAHTLSYITGGEKVKDEIFSFIKNYL